MPMLSKLLFLGSLISSLSAFSSFAVSVDCFTDDTARVEQTRRSVDQDDPEEMNRWYKQAIDANHAAMIHRVARLSIARQDVGTAYRMYEKGAHLGDYQSMVDLGVMWLKGEGRDVDLAKAYAWYLLAGEYIPMNWDENFFPPEKIKWHKTLAGDLEKKMTPVQVEAGKQYYEEQKKLIVCDWYAWLADYLKLAKKRQ
ncbi:MAG: hypothetical protein ABI648_05450 [Betaproteobacteria bacterium]|jgi:hypothetical protein